MDEQRLWAPWRLGYIRGESSDDANNLPLAEPKQWRAGADQACFLCRAAAEYAEDRAAVDQRLHVVERSEESITVLNRYPYNNGHVLVAPRRHVGELAELTPAEHLACMEQLGRLTRVFRRHMNAEGFNIGLNLGRVAGAGLPGHLHWHLVPRWNGDNNYMPVLADTRVISQSLDALWEALTSEWLAGGEQ